MRYKGENELRFSCDDKRNVTIVLGNNTFGKTTLAQAFRWGLYDNEGLNSTNYTKKKDIILLNNEVIAEMGTSTEQNVSVEIVIQEGKTQWKFNRTATFKRKSPGTSDLSITQVGESRLTMIVIQDGVQGPVINNNGANTGADAKKYKRGCVQDTINNMLPQQLSNYFFFDGERWNDTRLAKTEIKSSIQTILGVTGLLEMKKHLKDSQGSNVLKTLRNSIQGSGDEYERLQAEIKRLDENIEAYSEKIEEEDDALETLRRDRDALEKDLNDKRQIEEDQKEYKCLAQDIEQYERFKQTYYTDIVKEFSGSARFFAASLLPRVDVLLSKIDLEGKDIPGVTTDTVDYLVRLGKCLCGESLTPDSEAYHNLMQLRKVIPPEMIGGAAGKFRDLLESWRQDTKNLLADIMEKAVQFDSAQDTIFDKCDEQEKIAKRMDRRADVAALRRQYTEACTNYGKHDRNRNELIAKRTGDIDRREGKLKQLAKLAEQNEANRAINCAIAYAEAIYDFADRQAKKKQEGIFEQLNTIIAENFDKMFHDDEKYAKLEDDYRVHVYYHSIGGRQDFEEKNLSNGEATAINFVYIVSVLELAKRRAAQEDEMEGIINLPLVLDGPFSSLSNENTNLIAKKLPEFAEQVIIFMLDKDWEASGLDAYTLPTFCYRVNKEDKSNSSSLENGGVC